MRIIDSNTAPTNRAGRRSIARRGTALGGAGVVVAGSAAALLTAFAGSAGAAATITVDSNGDGVATAANCTDGIPNNCTIRDAAAAAVDGDTITFGPSVTNITLFRGEIMTQAVSIIGPGSAALTITTEGAPGSYNMFRIDGTGDALISGITFTKNRIKAQNNGKFTLDDVTVTGSSAGYGGALYASGGDLEIKNSHFEGNHASSNGGAIYIYNYANTTISDSEFINNDTDGDGGAIYSAYALDITLIGSEITGNTSGGRGGGLEFASGVEGLVTITDSTIDSNHSGEYGGGADFGDATSAVVSNTTVSNNTANGGAGLNFDGTGIDATVNNSTITANTSVNGAAGVYINAGSTLTINQSTITANIANGTSISYGGAGLAIGSDTTVVTMSGTIVSGNTAAVDGAADIGLYNTSPTETGSFTATNSLIGEVDSRVTINGTNNVTSTDPMLGALADNGGMTKTMALLPGSPAIDAGPNPVATFTGNQFDQRGTGFPRVVGGLVDIGAFETAPEPTTTTITDEPVAPAFTG